MGALKCAFDSNLERKASEKNCHPQTKLRVASQRLIASVGVYIINANDAIMYISLRELPSQVPPGLSHGRQRDATSRSYLEVIFTKKLLNFLGAPCSHSHSRLVKMSFIESFINFCTLDESRSRCGTFSNASDTNV